MDNLQEATRCLDRSFEVAPESAESHLAIMAAQAYALIEIAYALNALADCITPKNGLLHVATHKEE